MGRLSSSVSTYSRSHPRNRSVPCQISLADLPSSQITILPRLLSSGTPSDTAALPPRASFYPNAPVSSRYAPHLDSSSLRNGTANSLPQVEAEEPKSGGTLVYTNPGHKKISSAKTAAFPATNERVEQVLPRSRDERMRSRSQSSTSSLSATLLRFTDSSPELQMVLADSDGHIDQSAARSVHRNARNGARKRSRDSYEQQGQLGVRASTESTPPSNNQQATVSLKEDGQSLLVT